MGLDSVPVDDAVADSPQSSGSPVVPPVASPSPVAEANSASTANTAGAAATGSPATAQATTRPRRLWDSVLTAILLGVGIVSVTSSIPQYANFPATLNDVLGQMGYGEYSAVALATSIGIGLNVTQIVLYVASAVVALLMIRKGRLGFFYPLIAAVLFAVVMIVLLIVAFTGDPTLMASLTEPPTTAP